MVFKPLSDSRHRSLGAAAKTTTQADDDVDDLPVGVFFSAERSDVPSGSEPGLYYKDGTGSVRRVRFGRAGRFGFAALDEGVHFVALGEILVVPEVDPRAWAAAPDAVTKPLPQLATLNAGSFFTALGATEHSSWHRRGVYRLGKDGMIRRLLKDPARGLRWSDAIPGDRFGEFGQRLDVHED